MSDGGIEYADDVEIEDGMGIETKLLFRGGMDLRQNTCTKNNACLRTEKDSKSYGMHSFSK